MQTDNNGIFAIVSCIGLLEFWKVSVWVYFVYLFTRTLRLSPLTSQGQRVTTYMASRLLFKSSEMECVSGAYSILENTHVFYIVRYLFHDLLHPAVSHHTVCRWFHTNQAWRLNRVSRLFITHTHTHAHTHTSLAEHNVDQGHEISTFQLTVSRPVALTWYTMQTVMKRRSLYAGGSHCSDSRYSDKHRPTAYVWFSVFQIHVKVGKLPQWGRKRIFGIFCA